MIDPNTNLGTLVNEVPGRARVFDRYGLDYCCGGNRSLTQACAEAGASVEEVTEALRATPVTAAPDWQSMNDAELATHIVDSHHRFLWEELPRASALTAKIAEVHGANHPELAQVLTTYEALRADLEPHLLKEERILFPAIVQMENEPGSVAPATLNGPIRTMLSEHDTAGALLLELRRLTSDYTVPADGCATYTACYQALEAIEADTHEHIHKENNTLFPRVLSRA